MTSVDTFTFTFTSPSDTSPSPSHASTPPSAARPTSTPLAPPRIRIRALLIDVSGTLLVGPTPIPNAPHALARLRRSNIPFRLCTNTSKESDASLVKRLGEAGFGEGERLEREVWSSIGALGVVVRGLGVGREKVRTGTMVVVRALFIVIVIVIVIVIIVMIGVARRPYMLLSPSAMEEWECMLNDTTYTNTIDRPAATTSPRSTDLTTPSESYASPTDPPPPPSPSPSPQQHDAVIVGLAPAMLDYDHLNTAFRILIGDGQPKGASDVIVGASTARRGPGRPPLIALHKARYFASASSSTNDGSTQTLSLGPGPFVSALEEAAGTKAIVVGKPSKSFFEGCLRDLFRPGDGDGNGNEEEKEKEKGEEEGHGERQWNDVAVIGDDVLADLGEGAIELGLWRVLVKTGKYRGGDECRPGAIPPDQVCESFEAFVDWLLGEGSVGEGGHTVSQRAEERTKTKTWEKVR